MGVTGSFAASLPVSSSSSGIGLRKSTGRISGDEDKLVERLDGIEPVCSGGRRDLKGPSICGIEFESDSSEGNRDTAGDAIVTMHVVKTVTELKRYTVFSQYLKELSPRAFPEGLRGGFDGALSWRARL
jgi:hypothetical protein